MTVFQTIATILTLAAAGSYVNSRFWRLPSSIGMMVFALALSWGAIGAARLGWIDISAATGFVTRIDFSNIFLHGMLSFLLFAGALHIDLHDIRKYRGLIAFMATIGVVLATAITGTLIWSISRWLNIPMPYADALLFGALISPTDPVAVLGILKESRLAPSLRTKIGAESLLNDGAGVVVFLALLNMTAYAQGPAPDWNDLGMMLLRAGGGSLIAGLALGGLGYALLHGIDDYKTEVLLTLALAAGGYSLAEALDVSAPLAMVVAGLVVGNHGRAFAMSDKSRKHLDMFWELLDEIMNVVLFMLIGLVIVVISIDGTDLAMGLTAILATLGGRFLSIALPAAFLGRKLGLTPGTVGVMTWGGLRGGISIALALSLPIGAEKNMLLDMTYLTVAFSVLFQGTTFRYVAERFMPPRV